MYIILINKNINDDYTSRYFNKERTKTKIIIYYIIIIIKIKYLIIIIIYVIYYTLLNSQSQRCISFTPVILNNLFTIVTFLLLKYLYQSVPNLNTNNLANILCMPTLLKYLYNY